MPSGEPRISVSVLRGAVRDAIDRTSSHVVAKAVGLSAPGIREFANGSEPRSATIRKLTAWYIRQREHGSDAPVDAETAEAAIAFLLEHIPAQHRDDVRAALIQLIDSKGRQVGAPEPAWISDLRG
ncbi:hypothetical protein [Longimicrobium sp.]|jgi:hypothetical protein|uniref:hypothetical protein n=1 Tax=Longimicrobium sp. TaxID=2029185 RepID=UPI002F9388D3